MNKRPIQIDGKIAYVPLTKGHVAIVDIADVPLVLGFAWTAIVKKHIVYAKRATSVNGKTVTIRMHRQIMGAEVGTLVDHKNGNGLDNRRGNLRTATNSENLCNRGPQVNNTSGFKGVTFSKAAGKWQAQIKRHGKVTYLGLFDCPEDAAIARKKADAALHGEFAWGAENGVTFHGPARAAEAA